MENRITDIDGLSASMLRSIRASLLKRKETVSVAESVTSGLLQSAFAAIPDASLFFQGGLTAYNLGQKAKHLAIEPIHAEKVNCVSQQIADQMAAGAVCLTCARVATKSFCLFQYSIWGKNSSKRENRSKRPATRKCTDFLCSQRHESF